MNALSQEKSHVIKKNYSNSQTPSRYKKKLKTTTKEPAEGKKRFPIEIMGILKFLEPKKENDLQFKREAGDTKI